MIHVSEEFRSAMDDRTDFMEYAVIKFVDGRTLEVDSSKFTLSKNRFVSGASASSLPLGVAICNQIQLEIVNDDDWLKDYDFTNAEIDLYAVFEVSDGATEPVKFGTFTSTEPETYGSTVSVSAFDDMYLSDAPCVLSLGSNELTAGEFLSAVCDACGITLASTEFFNSDFHVQYYPTMNITYRAAIGYIAMVAGGNAYIDAERKLRIKTYDLHPVALYDLPGVDGGSYDPWTDCDAIDGGSYAFAEIDSVDAGAFRPWSQQSDTLMRLNKWSRLKIDTYPITITGLKITFSKIYHNADNTETDRGVYYLAGSDKYAIEVENPLLNGVEKEWADITAPIFIGAAFIKFEGDHASNPISEFMDVVLIEDRKGNVYQSVLTDISFSFLGSTSFSNSAESTLRNGCKYMSEAEEKLVPLDEQINYVSQELENEKSVREQAIVDLTNALADVGGMYYTYSRQDDGSVVTYAHDKKHLSESTNVIKINANAIGFSTDGGKTYPYGVTLDGTTITDILTATGISASWIESGTFEIKDGNGNVLFQASADNKKVQLSPYIFAQKDGLNIYKNGELAARIASGGIITYSDGNPAASLQNLGLALFDSEGNTVAELTRKGLRFFQDNTLLGSFVPAVKSDGSFGVLQISSSSGAFGGFAKYLKGTATNPDSDQTTINMVLETYTPGEKYNDRFTVDGTTSLPDGTTIPNITDHWYVKSGAPFYANKIYGTVHSSSDKRLKIGIKPTSIDAISTISKMRFNEFFWKSNGEFAPIGLVAQDLEMINEDLVCKPISDDDYYSLKTDSLLCLALKAIQDQESEISGLRKQIESMKDEIKKIKEDISDG